MQFLTEVIQPQMKAKAISAPLFMGGNSLGGLVASYVVLAKPDAFAGLVMQSPGMTGDVRAVPNRSDGSTETRTPIAFVVGAIVGVLCTAMVPCLELLAAVRRCGKEQDRAGQGSVSAPDFVANAPATLLQPRGRQMHSLARLSRFCFQISWFSGL